MDPTRGPVAQRSRRPCGAGQAQLVFESGFAATVPSTRSAHFFFFYARARACPQGGLAYLQFAHLEKKKCNVPGGAE